MRLLIDGFYLNKPRGLGRYVQELIYALSHHARQDVVMTVVIPKDMEDRFLIEADVVRYVRRPRLPFPIWEQLFLPLFVRTGRFDVIHFPYNTKPAVINTSRQPHVVTVHDLIFLDGGAGTGYYQKLGNLYRRWALNAVARGRVVVITDSEYGTKLIGRHLNCAIEYAYIPVEHFASSIASNSAVLADVEYCLHIGGNSPRKNTARCIEAFLAADQKGVKLIVVGMSNDCEIARKYASDRVQFPGWVSDGILAELMANAKAILFPSLMEGYGLPVVEAFAFGKPLLTSDLPPMNEVAGDAAVLVDPMSMESIRDAIKAIILDKELGAALIGRGFHRMSDISSKKMAEKMVGFYRDAMRAGGC